MNATQSVSNQVPSSVIDLLERLIFNNLEWNRKVKNARQSDVAFGGNGRYVFESCANCMATESDFFLQFRDLAKRNNVYADIVLKELGYEPLIQLTELERNWAFITE